jgi:hypothetical protein
VDDLSKTTLCPFFSLSASRGNKARISYFRQLSVTARNDILEMEDIPFEKIGEFAGLIKDRLCQWSGEHTRLGCDVRRPAGHAPLRNINSQCLRRDVEDGTRGRVRSPIPWHGSRKLSFLAEDQ